MSWHFNQRTAQHLNSTSISAESTEAFGGPKSSPSTLAHPPSISDTFILLLVFKHKQNPTKTQRRREDKCHPFSIVHHASPQASIWLKPRADVSASPQLPCIGRKVDAGVWETLSLHTLFGSIKRNRLVLWYQLDQ